MGTSHPGPWAHTPFTVSEVHYLLFLKQMVLRGRLTDGEKSSDLARTKWRHAYGLNAEPLNWTTKRTADHEKGKL